MARVLALESMSFMVRRNTMRHSVMNRVKAMYTTSVTKVMTANHALYLPNRMAATSPISSSVGRMLNSMKLSRKLMPARAALDVARHAAGLPLQVKAQAQAMQMLEHLQRHAPDGALRDLGEHRIAQFAEQRAEQTQQAIADHQETPAPPAPPWACPARPRSPSAPAAPPRWPAWPAPAGSSPASRAP